MQQQWVAILTQNQAAGPVRMRPSPVSLSHPVSHSLMLAPVAMWL